MFHLIKSIIDDFRLLAENTYQPSKTWSHEHYFLFYIGFSDLPPSHVVVSIDVIEKDKYDSILNWKRNQFLKEIART